MRSLFPYVTFVILLISSHGLKAQNETKKWFFGQFAGLDFTTSSPGPATSSGMAAEEGCASMSFNNGASCFYSNGEKIVNPSHQVMANGSGLAGEPNLSQGVMIAKQPGQTNLYYVFTANRSIPGFRYSIVDMSLASGSGSVIAKNIVIDSASTIRVCGTKHCNGTDVWIITKDNISNVFKARLLSATGLSSVAVTSTIGSITAGRGTMKVSPNGRLLAQAIALPSAFELFDFDPATGILSNSVSLPMQDPAYACEFSPDGSKLYGSLFGLSGSTNRLVQWDLCSGTSTAIAASAYTLNATHTGQLQLADNGSIYHARAAIKRIRTSPESSIELLIGEPAIGVIYNPNVSGPSVFYNNTGQSVSPGLSLFGLPNHVSGFYKSFPAKFTYSINPAVNCSRVYFSSPPLINNTCSATSYTIQQVLWIFDDISTPTQSTSTLFNPDHIYPGVGSYQVKLVLYNACGAVIDTVKQEVQVGGALLNSPNSLTLCSGKSITLMASGPNSYTWSTGAIGNSIVVSPTVNTTYSLGFTDAFGCNYQSAKTVTVYPSPNVVVSGKDSLCETQTATLTVSGALTYSWSNGSTNTSIKVTPSVSTVYQVTGTSSNGCSVQVSKPITVKLAPVPVITGNTVICLGNAATVIATGGAGITWNNGTIGPTLVVVPDWNLGYVFSATAKYSNGCSRFERVRFKLVPFPEVKLAGTASLCLGSSVTLSANASGSAISYSWSSGDITSTVVVSPSVSTLYSVVVTNTDNCSVFDTLRIKVNPTSPENSKAFGSATLCAGSSAVLNAEGGSEYNWTPKPVVFVEGQQRVQVTPSITTVYTVIISTDSACKVSRTVEVTIRPKPDLWLGNDTVFNLDQPMYLRARGSGTISWVSGEGLSCTSCIQPQIFPSEKTVYKAVTINEYGCTNSDEITVDIGAELGIYAPTAFTPNGDGLNDDFKIRGFGLMISKLTVFNRWGLQVFSTANGDHGWDGTYKGKSCDNDVYTWVLEFHQENGNTGKKTGFVRIMR